MASTVTLTQMISDVREYADMVNSQFVTDATIMRHLNLALRELYDKLIAANGNYYDTAQSVPVVSGTATYSFAADFYKLISMDRCSAGVGSPITAQLQAFQPLEIPRQTWGGDPNMPRYRLLAGKFELLPAPSTFNLVVRYIPTMTALSAGGDTFDGVNGFEKWATLEAACQCLLKEESDISGLRVEQGRVDLRIQHMAADRDAFQTTRIIDVSDRFFGYIDDEDRLPRP